MKIDENAVYPFLIPKQLHLRTGEEVIIRPLLPSYVNELGIFLENLSADTKKRFQPHPLTKAYANEILSQKFRKRELRMITLSGYKIISYFLLEFSFPVEKKRYLKYSIHLSEEFDCKIAPVVADNYQNSGLGSLVMKQALIILRDLDVRYVVLSGGTQTTNQRAVHFYEKFGFHKIGEFEENNMDNLDMYLKL